MTAIETLKEAYLVGCLEINPGGVDTWDSQRVMSTKKIISRNGHFLTVAKKGDNGPAAVVVGGETNNADGLPKKFARCTRCA